MQQADATWEVCGEAANGREAVERAVELAPDLVILDIAMPVLDGIGAAKAIRAQLPDLPILMYTFMSFDRLEILAKEAGAQAVVQKGDSRALVREMRRVLSETPAADGQATSYEGRAEPVSNATAGAGWTAASAEMDASREQMAEPSATGMEPSASEVDPGS